MNDYIGSVMARAVPHEQLPLPESGVHTYQRFCLCPRCRSVRAVMTEDGKRLAKANEMARRIQELQRIVHELLAESRRELFAAKAAAERAKRLEQEAGEASVRG